jgi:hypothetical protein
MSLGIGYAEHAAKPDIVKVGVNGGGQPAQPQAIIEIGPPERVGGFRLTNQGDTLVRYQLCLQGKLRSIAGEVLSAAVGIATLRGVLAFKQIVPGTVSIVETAAANETFTDPAGDGVLVGDQGGSGTIDYDTGAYDLTFAAVSTGNTTAAYDTTGWIRYGSTADLAGGGGGKYEELEPTLGDAWADAIKGQSKIGIEAYCLNANEMSQLEVEAIHFGDDSFVKLDLPPEIGANLNA